MPKQTGVRMTFFDNPRAKAAVEFGGLGAILAVNFLVLNFLAFRFFNFFDFSSFLDASWRVSRGQLPYVDFIYNTGPLHLYLNAFFIKLLGFSKTAILAHLVILSSAVVLITFRMTRSRIPVWASLLVSAFSAVCFYWNFPHPWYDHSSYFWGIPAIAVLVMRMPFQNAKAAFWCAFFAGVMGVFSWATKTNTGAGYLVFFLIVLLLNRQQRWAGLGGYAAGAGAAALVILGLIRAPNLYFDQTVAVYGNINKDRLIRFYLLPVYFRNLYWLVLLIALYPLFFGAGMARLAGRLRAAREAMALSLKALAERAGVTENWIADFEKGKTPQADVGVLARMAEALGCKLDVDFRHPIQKYAHLAVLLAGTIFAALFALHTSSLREAGMMPLYGIIMGIGFIMLYASKADCYLPSQVLLHRLAIAALAVLTVGLLVWEVKLSMGLAFGKDSRVGYGEYSIQAEPFRGWHTVKEQGEALDGLVEFVRRHVGPEDSLLILGDMQVLNGLTGRDGYKGIPFIFDVGVMPAPGPQVENVSRTIQGHLPDWIVTRRQKGPYPINALIPYLGLSDMIMNSYQLVQTWSDYGMFKKKGTA